MQTPDELDLVLGVPVPYQDQAPLVTDPKKRKFSFDRRFQFEQTLRLGMRGYRSWVLCDGLAKATDPSLFSHLTMASTIPLSQSFHAEFDKLPKYTAIEWIATSKALPLVFCVLFVRTLLSFWEDRPVDCFFRIATMCGLLFFCQW